MNRLIKLLILITLSLSVYFIYDIAKNSQINILNLGDGLCTGITSYGIKDYSYSDYYLMNITSYKTKTNLIKKCSREMSIKMMLNIIKNDSKIKKDLKQAHILIINLGYNDLLYKLSITENMNIYKLNYLLNTISNDYNELIKEIQKYYDNQIIVIGYFKTNSDDYYLNYGLKRLNNIIMNNNNVTYIETYNLLNNRSKYFSNPNSYYPNSKGYIEISRKITKKLAKN